MRVYRQVCLLRANGALVEATRMESVELESALAKASAESPVEISWADHFLAEQLRISEAQLLAELLAPLLAGQLQPSGLPLPSSAPDPNGRRIDPGSSSAEKRRATAPPLEVADFIEGMLTQERNKNAQGRTPPALRSLSTQHAQAPTNHQSS